MNLQLHELKSHCTGTDPLCSVKVAFISIIVVKMHKQYEEQHQNYYLRQLDIHSFNTILLLSIHTFKTNTALSLGYNLNFNACKERACAYISIMDDDIVEKSESFTISLERTTDLDSRISLSSERGEVTILDDDGMLTNVSGH